MITRNIFNTTLYLVLSTLFVVIGCSSNVSDTQTATIQGSVNMETTQQQKVQSNDLEGTVVTAARVTSSGSLETIEGTKTDVSNSGEFTLDADVESNQHIAIIADNGETQWRGFLMAGLENGSTYTLKPLDGESTSETAVFAALVASGNANIVNKSDIETVVTSAISSEVKSNSSAAAQLASGLKTAAQARAEYYRQNVEDNSEAALEATVQAMTEAQLRLESELAEATSEAQREEAYELFMAAIVEAHVQGGLTNSDAATSIEMWSRVVVNGIALGSTELKNTVHKNASLMASFAIDAAARAEAESSDMKESTKQAISEAGAELKAAVKASSGVATDIKAAFETYHEEVRTAIENDGKFQASVVLEIDSEINASNGSKAVFSSAISGIVSASLINQAYATFYSSIESQVKNKMSSPGEADAELLARLLFLINLKS